MTWNQIIWESLLKYSVEILAKIKYIHSHKFSYTDMETLQELLKQVIFNYFFFNI